MKKAPLPNTLMSASGLRRGLCFHAAAAVVAAMLGSSLSAASDAVAVSAAGNAPVAVEYKSALFLWIISAVLVLALVLGGAWHFSNTGMKRWAVGRRITAGFATVLVVLSVVAFFGYAGLRQAFDEFAHYRADARHSNLAGRIQANVLEARIALKNYRISPKAEDVARKSCLPPNYLVPWIPGPIIAEFLPSTFAVPAMPASSVCKLITLTSIKCTTSTVPLHGKRFGRRWMFWSPKAKFCMSEVLTLVVGILPKLKRLQSRVTSWD